MCKTVMRMGMSILVHLVVTGTGNKSAASAVAVPSSCTPPGRYFGYCGPGRAVRARERVGAVESGNCSGRKGNSRGPSRMDG